MSIQIGDFIVKGIDAILLVLAIVFTGLFFLIFFGSSILFQYLPEIASGTSGLRIGGLLFSLLMAIVLWVLFLKRIEVI